MAKQTGNELDGIIDGIDGKKITAELKKIVENNDLTIEDATNKFISSLKSTYVKLRVKDSEEKLKYALNAVKSLGVSSKSFSSKPTTAISVVIRNSSSMIQNSGNVTEETRDFNKDSQIGIAGSWRKCTTCNRIWDTADPENGDNCPSCNGTNSVILAGQAVPVKTMGILNRKDMSMGDISIYNTQITSVFLYNGETYEEAYIKFTGKQRELLQKVKFGIPFDINVDANVFENPTTGQKWYNTTGTSKVTPCSISDFMDILEIYSELSSSLISPLDAVNDKDFCTLFLMIIDEPEKPKDKWLINLCDPESESGEPEIITVYLEDEHVAKQLHADDAGIFEGKYSESTRTVDGVEEKFRVLNINVESMGAPIYIMGEKGTKLIST